MPRFRASVGHPPFIIVKRANPVNLVGQAVGLTLGSGTFAYTPSHYVAPFASVSGASNDYADLGATSWANAANSGTPTTLGTAMARAVAGNKVQCAAGLYTGENWNLGSSASTHRYTGCFQPTNNGTFGNPIIFFAVNPAANNYGSTELYSEIRRPSQVAGGTDTASPLTLCPSGSSYIVFDGFYANEAQVRPGAVSGLFSMNDCSNCEYRRMVADRDATLTTTTYPNGGNFGMLYIDGTTNCKLADVYVNGQPGTTSDNDANIELYGNLGLIVEYCTFEDARWPLYVKTNSLTQNQTPTIRYCKFLNCRSGPENQTNQSVTYLQNLVIALDVGFLFENQDGTLSPVTATNNTVVLTNASAPAGDRAGFYFRSGINYDGSVYRDNLVYIKSGANSALRLVERDSPQPNTGWADITFNYNHYYDADSTPTWSELGTTYTSLAAWQAAVAGDANSTYSDPLFTNVATNDFTLQGGSPARTSSSTGGPVGCYITGSENIGVRASPSY